MRVQTVKREAQLREWAAQISECQRSGMNVSQWCEMNGIGRKTYYYHLKVLREEILEQAELSVRKVEPGTALASARASTRMLQKNGETSLSHLDDADECRPVFTELGMSAVLKTMITVRTDRVAVEIANGADAALVEQVVRLAAMI
jgi:hypothetical protein